jgi:uroporphyrin-3 C-methyltransferase
MARVSGLGERVDKLTGRVEQLETRAADLPAALPAAPDEAMQSAIEANRDATARLEDRLASLDERLDTLSEPLAAVPAGPVEPPTVVDLPPAPAGLAWRGAEIELLLRVAQRRVALAGDPAGARTALSEADRLIEEVDEPELLPVRRQIADDLTALDSLPALDIDGIAFRLGSLQAQVASLPVREGAARGEAPAGTGEAVPEQGLERLERKSMEFISGLVRVRDSSADDRVFQTPAELWFLRRNLELELQSARVALLTGNSAVFRDSLSKAAHWTEDYFDPQDPAVTAFVESLRELEARPIAVDYPELGALGVYLDVTAPADE